MFNLELTWDRPAKISANTTDHVLRVRILPQGSTPTATLPLYLALALDTSGSMAGEKLQQAKLACQSVITQLRDRDRFSLASYATQVSSLVQNLQGAPPSNSLDRLVADGVTRTDLALDWLQTALPSTPGVARVALLITDGHATNAAGRVLEDVSTLVKQAEQMAAAGIVLCTVGLGNAANFNTAFLVDLSDRGRGAFLYADTPTALEPLLQARLMACQAIATEGARLRLHPMSDVKVIGFCRFRPEYLPLEEMAPQELALGLLRSDGPTDILLQVRVPPLGFGEPAGSKEVLTVELLASGVSGVSGRSSITYTSSFREAQQIHDDVNRDYQFWEMNLWSTELTRTTDPKRTGELLVNIQVNAMKTGQAAIVQQVTQQLEDLKRTGQLDLHKTTGLLRDSRQLGGV